MSNSSVVSLGALRLQAQQRADLVNSPAVSDSEWNGYITNSYKELYDMLVAAYGNDYYVATPYQFAIGSSQFYPLPPDHYKLLGVDLMYSQSPTGWVSLKRFEFIERNKYSYPNANSNYLGYTNLRYRLSGSNIEFIPVPAASQTAQIWYIPEPTSLMFMPTCSTTLLSPVVGVSFSQELTVGMSVAGQSIIPGTTIIAVDTTLNQVTLSSPVSSTQPVLTLQFWTDAVTIDGISGWEEYVIVDAAIKAMVKQEQDVSELRIQKAMLIARIEGMAEGRDAGQAHHVSDALSINGWGYDGGGGGGGYGDVGWGGGY